jgi:DNA primase large subunit
MEVEKFEQAKKIKENLERLKIRKYKLESAFNSFSLSVKIEFVHSGYVKFRKDEVWLSNENVIREMVSKELEILKESINLVEEEFNKL